ncbi:hypothetical protein P153DRAFT_324741 [Dothidotthia symphoricarpi CBS 119687]|uniref:PSI domain-containing protein n=1 Tax=Dothidotthia symphoricarpi CBS 119687 TaxID=1392245 RepID=A0A6A6A3F2_9PLEO|nr:uncharacterized protein P153DRAFT_324741 [Dothidotthia symphoricarpi CBS 119687]KAF2125437.1 hypothetical protein P153DRAFT_324741 [Dothidotthia symphoricarpi CBS 119687]
MASKCPSPSLRSADVALLNVTELLHERYQDAPTDDWERLVKCWGYNDCGDCHRSKGHCGWCAISGTCLPLPKDRLSRAFPLLTPIRHKNICALGSERFELRTSGLGCQVSTITFLTAIVTIFATIFGLLVLYGLVQLLKWVRIAFNNGGWRIHEDGTEEIWVRKGESWGRWWRRLDGDEREFEVEEVDGGTAERSWHAWGAGGRGQNGSAGERRSLLG